MATELAQDYAAEFHREWTAAENTPVEFPPLDVNALVKRHHRVGGDLVVTKSMVWDMLVRKAYAPETYAPGRVRAGSVRTYSTEEPDFVLMSDQRLWIDESRYTQVIQRVYVDQDRHAVFHLGTAHLTTPDGAYEWAGIEQPLYHLEYVVTGTELRPVLRRRVVHLTDAYDSRMSWHFARLVREQSLIEMVEIYLRLQWGIELGLQPLSA
ncbi:hypothetical protein [Kibdelosporangium phytohabitans]|uniref:Uncharacterized protein n=1 Tax=Kibdelosporangium phytohabitans TaxID=860235 RepID=A0A0N9HUR3_9PSEU|nr:hypothetical protein [Kibdelosporangium phytohabitans]ALG08764.1 hypothetical protein AOZ06_19230 [Kibdelosporangium phytohabitans]MBE1470113.1 replicative superfamily II helicase [Kibdelosporangium phytohabitans]